MAVMIVSASIPFSLASASIVCINGFCIIFPGQKPPPEPRPGNQLHGQPVHASSGSLEQHGGVLAAAQPSFERLLVVARLAAPDLRGPPGEPPVVVLSAQR